MATTLDWALPDLKKPRGNNTVSTHPPLPPRLAGNGRQEDKNCKRSLGSQGDVVKRSGGGRSAGSSTCFFFFKRSLSVGWTQAWRQAKMVRMRKWRRRGMGRRMEDPKYLIVVQLYPCRAAVKILCLAPRCIGQLWRVPQIKITSWEDSDAKGWWVGGGCRKED